MGREEKRARRGLYAVLAVGVVSLVLSYVALHVPGIALSVLPVGALAWTVRASHSQSRRLQRRGDALQRSCEERAERTIAILRDMRSPF